MTGTTAVYVDGYNFYYGRIRGTSYKWVDIVTLFERLVHEQTPTSQMTLVRYFSAFCLARFSTHGNASTIVMWNRCYAPSGRIFRVFALE